MSDPPANPLQPDPPRRPYTSPKRDQAARRTRHKIREAAETLFLRDGYTRTSMKAIAKQAGVSEKTMYLAYETKAKLLRHVIDVAARGDEALTPLPRRPEWRAIFAGSPDEILARFAAQNARVMKRTAAIVALAESAADTDPQLAEQRGDAHKGTRDDLRSLAAALNRLGVLAPNISEQDAADIIYAVACDERIYLRLTRECGWTQDRYADLIARTLNATLANRDTSSPPPSSPDASPR